jgi:hypothetical protein
MFYDLNGGTGSASVSAINCDWMFTGGGGFVTIQSGASGSGGGKVTFTVAPNGTSEPRSTTLTAGGRSFTIRHSGVPPTNGSFLAYRSAPGDYIGLGMAHLFRYADASWDTEVEHENGTNQVRITINQGPFSGVDWSLHLAAPSGQPLVPGTYESAARWPFQPAGSPGLAFSGDGRGCNKVTGRFVVIEAVYGPGNTLLRFHATFEQHCEGGAAALMGEVRVLADPWR